MEDPLETRLDADILARIFPEAETRAPVEGDPPFAAVHGGGEVIGWLFSTHETVRPRGYSGQSFDIVVGLDSAGAIRGHVILEEREPLIDPSMIPPEAADRYIAQTHGLDLAGGERFAPRHVDGVSGATVSVTAMRRAVLNAASATGYRVGVLSDRGGLSLDRTSFAPRDWGSLLADGSVRRMAVPGAAGEAETIFYAALATPPMIGRNLLGERRFRTVMEAAAHDAQQIVVGSVGPRKWLPANPWLVDKVDGARLVQGESVFDLLTRDFSPARALPVAGAPDFDGLARFAVAGDRGFDPLAPWALEIDADGRSFSLPWRVPGDLVRGDLVALEDAGFRAPVRVGVGGWRESTLADWQRLWIDRQWDIAALAALPLAPRPPRRSLRSAFRHPPVARLDRRRPAHRPHRDRLVPGGFRRRGMGGAAARPAARRAGRLHAVDPGPLGPGGVLRLVVSVRRVAGTVERGRAPAGLAADYGPRALAAAAVGGEIRRGGGRPRRRRRRPRRRVRRRRNRTLQDGDYHEVRARLAVRRLGRGAAGGRPVH